MTKRNDREKLEALKTAALLDLMATSDEEVLKEFMESGGDTSELSKLKSSLRAKAAATLRGHLNLRKTTMVARPQPPMQRPPLPQLKTMVQHAMASKGSELAYRDGGKQSDEDWISLYDDMVLMGLIEPESNGS